MSGPIRNFEAAMCSVDIVDVINEERKAEAAGMPFKTIRHDHFMVKLEKHPGIDSPKFLGQYKDSTGRMLKCYNLPKREAELMVMSESLKVQTRVYDRLAAIEAGTTAPAVVLPPEHQAIVALLYESAALKAKQAELETTQAQHQASIARIEAKQSAFENGVSYFTVIGYGTFKGIKFSNSDAAAMGRKASALSKAAGISTDKVRDPRFGEVGSYHESMLDQALTALYGGM